MQSLINMSPSTNQLTGMSAATNSILQSMLQQLKQLNNTGQPYVYVSDVESVLTTQNNADLGDLSPIVSFQTPPLPMILNTLAIEWDSNTSQNYKYRWQITGVNNANPDYIQMSQSALSINIFSGNSIPIPANASINLYSYDYNSASEDGNLQLYLLGFLHMVGGASQ